jgi:phenylacetate-coenzyme A ligase PaaK-like adenylate-forming protein
MALPAGWFKNLSRQMISDLQERIFNISSQDEFIEAALAVFNYQYEHNPVYNQYITALGKERGRVKDLTDIPFLPVEFFKTHRIITGSTTEEMIFESSGTTGTMPGRHFVTDLSLYERSFSEAFNLFYCSPADLIIMALLPSYTERGSSSLVYMADKLIRESNHPLSGFYKANSDSLITAIKKGRAGEKKILLLGVSFALLGLAESLSPDLSGVIVMETGGMKGRRKEMIRPELHDILKKKLNIDTIHSEYGMTELLSQAYSSGGGIFYSPPWMRILLRDPQDPLSLHTKTETTGGINIIDLANINSCSFIATGDLGRLHHDGGFEVLGRFDNSDIRGCNLLVEQ